jgi:TolB-like protein/Tfp pilus assembly protein PilF
VRSVTGIGSFFAQLKRRNVFKVAAAYAVVGWLLIQGAVTVLPNVGAPPWTATVVIVLVLVGLPVALVLAWAYELQPAGDRAVAPSPTSTTPDPAAAAAASAMPVPTTAPSSLTGPLPAVTTPAKPPAPGAEPATASRVAQSDERPSIAVLPFMNMLGDPAQEYFADGMTEDLITDLAKISGLCVIARNSSFTFKGQAVDVREAARTLGARYVVEGSVRKAGERVRINAQLIDAGSGAHVWAERYDGDLAAVFDLQDEILAKIVSALKISLNVGEKARLESRMTSNLKAYDLFLRGRSEFYRFTPESHALAIELLEQAAALDPQFAAAHAYLSQARMAGAVSSLNTSDFEVAAQAALKSAETAVACDESLGLAYAFLAWTQLWLRRYDEANANFERALARAPNDAEVLGYYGQSLNYSGDPDRALTMLDAAAKLDPLLPPNIRFVRGATLLLLNRGEEAVETLRTVMRLAPDFAGAHYLCAAALIELGRADEARAVVSAARERLPESAVTITLSAFRRVPFRDERFGERIAAALHAAGVRD